MAQQPQERDVPDNFENNEGQHREGAAEPREVGEENGPRGNGPREADQEVPARGFNNFTNGGNAGPYPRRRMTREARRQNHYDGVSRLIVSLVNAVETSIDNTDVRGHFRGINGRGNRRANRNLNEE